MSKNTAPEILPPVSVKKRQRKGFAVPGPGRPRGIPNRTTGLLKHAILEAADLAGRDVRPGDPEAAGLVNYLRWLAVEEAPTFGTLLGKVLPLQVAGDPDNPVTTHNVIEIKIVDPD